MNQRNSAKLKWVVDSIVHEGVSPDVAAWPEGPKIDAIRNRRMAWDAVAAYAIEQMGLCTDLCEQLRQDARPKPASQEAGSVA
jgi:hypothetical protein